MLAAACPARHGPGPYDYETFRPMNLVQLSDLHICPPGSRICHVVDSNAMAERAIRAVASLRPVPDAVVISGDLTDCGRPAEYALLAPLIRRHLPMPVFVVPGNHDRRDNFRTAFADLFGVTRHPHFVQYVVEDLPVRLVMLDSVVPGDDHGELCEARLAWLEQALQAAPERATMLVLHHPPLLCGLSMLDSINLRSAPALAALLARHRQVERVLCGHHHRSIVGRIAGAIVCVAPATAHQSELALQDDRGRFTLEPPGYLLHQRQADGQIATHGVLVESFPGPFDYVGDPDYPGRAGP
jgi:Icc-related predicted phosphoesterase